MQYGRKEFVNFYVSLSLHVWSVAVLACTIWGARPHGEHCARAFNGGMRAPVRLCPPSPRSLKPPLLLVR